MAVIESLASDLIRNLTYGWVLDLPWELSLRENLDDRVLTELGMNLFYTPDLWTVNLSDSFAKLAPEGLGYHRLEDDLMDGTAHYHGNEPKYLDDIERFCIWALEDDIDGGWLWVL